MSVRRRLVGTGARLAAVTVVAAGAAVVPLPATGTTISGYVFRDVNDNGVRDPGEPGVPGIRVRLGSGSVSTLTAADGGYVLRGLPDSGNISVETGWLRSQYPDPATPTSLTCPPGPGPDNDFSVVNQFLRYPLTGAAIVSNVDLGLLPDWPGDALLPPPGDVPANPVDVAARLSWVRGSCTGGAYNICRAGDTFILNAQVYNQGTTALSGVVAKLLVPAGDCLTGVRLVGSAVSAGVTGLSTAPSTYTCDTRQVAVVLHGNLPPAGAAYLAVTGRTWTGPGTPGCAPGAVVAATCTSAEPQGRGWLFAVSHIDQPGDPDSDFCAAGDPARCPTGLHDKRRNPDEVDPVGHNVDAGLGGTKAVDVQAFYTVAGPTGLRHPGDRIRLRAWAGNQVDGRPANQVNPGTALRVYLPPGTAVVLPPRHALLTCTAGTATGAVLVTCTYHGPLSPALSGVAVNLTATIPETWPVGTVFHTVACAAPPAAQAGAERIRAGACGPGTDAGRTATDNDASLDLTVS